MNSEIENKRKVVLKAAATLGITAAAVLVLPGSFAGAQSGEIEEAEKACPKDISRVTRIMPFNGSSGGDSILGMPAERNIISGQGGDDCLDGGSQDDQLHGGAGNDIINGYHGDDISDGADGDDIVNAGLGDDITTGGDGDDIIRSGAGDDHAHGNDGDDILFDGPGDDVQNGNRGDDILFDGPGDDVLNGNEGNDLAWLNEGNNEFNGNGGNDTVIVTELAMGTQIIDTGWGDDMIDLTDVVDLSDRLASGNVLVNGGSGTDTAFVEYEHLPAARRYTESIEVFNYFDQANKNLFNEFDFTATPFTENDSILASGLNGTYSFGDDQTALALAPGKEYGSFDDSVLMSLG